MKENIQTTSFTNGLTVLTERMPGARSASLGVWTRRGSRHEPEQLNGISHFIEHAVFKGTTRRSALDIAVEIDRLGGSFDAFTSHESVGFVLKVADKSLPKAFDLLADMLLNPLFDEKELRRERRVIVEEMKMVEDMPEEFLGEIFQAAFFPDNTLGLPIEGTRRTVRTFDRERTRNFHARLFEPQNLIVAAAGNLRHEKIELLAGNLFTSEKVYSESSKSERAFQNSVSENLNFGNETLKSPQLAAPIILKKKRGLEQAHLIIAAPWIASGSDKRYSAYLFESILGGGTSSRLWQQIRERRGLAYSVGAGGATFSDCGVFSIFAATSPENLSQTIDLTVQELRKIKTGGVSADELRLAKEQAHAAILLGLEDSAARASNLAQQEMTFGKTISLDETLRRIEAVETDEIAQLADEFFRTETIALAALGNLKNFKIARERLDVG
ncbi:MAG: insulinase family protein [Acidobacteria bacterium]|nr:insulinase family protein [Acidobacteriota bacterium]